MADYNLYGIRWKKGTFEYAAGLVYIISQNWQFLLDSGIS
jgi:hypothetical protein